MDEDRDGPTLSASRVSLSALLSPAQSPRPSASSTPAPNGPNGEKQSLTANGHGGQVNGNGADAGSMHANANDSDSDVEMYDASEVHAVARINPTRRSKTAATAEGLVVPDEADGDEEEEDGDFGPGSKTKESVEVQDDDDDDEDDEDEDDEDDDDDDDDDDDEDDDDDDEEDTNGEESEAVDGIGGAGSSSTVQDGSKSAKAGKQRVIEQIDVDGDDDDDDDRDSMMEEIAGEANGDRAVGAEGAEIAAVKPKKKWKKRSPSVDVSLPVGPPPRPTVRLKLSLSLKDETKYMTNVPDEVYRVLKETGKSNPWTDWYEREFAAPGGAEDFAAGTPNGLPDTGDLGGLARLLQKYPSKPTGKGKGKGKRAKDMEYDVHDPFVDDSELNVDEPTYSAKPSADGFFVSEGEVKLQQIEKTKPEPLDKDALAASYKRNQIPPGFGQTDPDTSAGGAGALFLEFGPESTCATVVNHLLARHAVAFGVLTQREEDDGEAERKEAAEKAKNLPAHDMIPKKEPSTPARDTPSKAGSRESPIKVDDEDGQPPFQPIQAVKYAVHKVPKQVEREFIKLRLMAAKESWLKKTKFPPNLRDPLIEAARIAIGLNEYNDNFFNWLPQIFPYNRHTLLKFVTRQIFTDHVGYMDKLLDMNEAGMKKQIDALYSGYKKDYDEAMARWMSRGSREPTPVEGAISATPADAAADGGNEDGDGEKAGGGVPVNKDGKPIQRWHWTEPLREALFTILTIDNAKAELLEQKHGLEGVQEKLSVINARKAIYKRLTELWPEDGWVVSTALSNQYGLYKRKVEKFATQLQES